MNKHRIIWTLLIISILGLGARVFYLQYKLDNENALVGKCVKTAWQCVYMLQSCKASKTNLIDMELQ